MLRLTPAITPARGEEFFSTAREAPRRHVPIFLDALHLVWGRVVPDFCRELVAALAGE